MHKRIGVEPKHYLSAIKILQDILRKTLKESISNEDVFFATFDALKKLLFFDIEFVFDTYIRSLISEIELAKEKAENYAVILEERVAARTRELLSVS